MPERYEFGPGATRDSVDPGRRAHRIFLLAILFGVLGMKGFLWTAFIIALLLYLFDLIILPVLSVRAIELGTGERMTPDERALAPKGPLDGNGILTTPPDGRASLPRELGREEFGNQVFIVRAQALDIRRLVGLGVEVVRIERAHPFHPPAVVFVHEMLVRTFPMGGVEGVVADHGQPFLGQVVLDDVV